MQLTQFSDYALRLVLYLAAHPGRLVPVHEVSDAYGVSTHHLVKVVQLLVRHGFVASTRGRLGGLQLAMPPARVNIGGLVRLTEPHFDLLECFDRSTNTCPIERACGLKGAVMQAQVAFLSVLDRYTLADFAPRAPQLVQLWAGQRAAGARRRPPRGRTG